MSQLCRVSVIFELDNASFEDFPVWSSRLLGLMRWVSLSVPPEAVEFIVVHVGSSAIDDLLATLPDELASRVVMLDLDGLPSNYYQMKNAGAQIAKGEYLVFLDSDLVPVDGSFNDLLRPVEEGRYVAACGQAFFPTDSFLERCYAVFWMFPIYKFAETMGKQQFLASNAVISRQWIIENGLFLQVGGFKVSCALMSRKLKDRGHSIAHPDVWFRHAVWSTSLRFFIWRAMVMGRDADKKLAYGTPGAMSVRTAGALRSFKQDIARLFNRHLRYGRKVGLGPLGCMGSFFIGVVFFTFVRSAQLSAALRSVSSMVELIPERYIT